MPERRETGRPSREGWPSLEDQLEAAGAPRGSALEQLIRENQDLDMLNKEEAHDKLGLPPWLRIFWRKKHPEARYAAHDPSGGYPRVLKRILAWMLAHHDLRATQYKL